MAKMSTAVWPQRLLMQLVVDAPLGLLLPRRLLHPLGFDSFLGHVLHLLLQFGGLVLEVVLDHFDVGYLKADIPNLSLQEVSSLSNHLELLPQLLELPLHGAVADAEEDEEAG